MRLKILDNLRTASLNPKLLVLTKMHLKKLTSVSGMSSSTIGLSNALTMSSVVMTSSSKVTFEGIAVK